MQDDGQRLGVIEFGRLLLETEDLDPLYVILRRSGMTRGELCRWLVCYWCYYHAGLCSWVVDQGRPRFWKTLKQIAEGGKEYPRGTERRHFRGRLAMESIDRLCRRFVSAENLVNWLAKGESAYGVCARVLSLYGFGDWIKWKIPDMLERLGIARIEFELRDLRLMFSTSKEGAEETCRVCSIEATDGLVGAHQYLILHLGGMLAPPLYDRTINVQETETIFCKWKSHLGGHYPVGKDTIEIAHGLKRYEKTSPTAARLLEEANTLCEKSAKVFSIGIPQ